MSQRRQHSLAPLAAAGFALALWYGVPAVAGWLRGVSFPTPHETLWELGRLLAGRPLSGHTVYRHIGASLARWAAGFALAAVLGVAYGMAAGWWLWLERMSAPLVYTAQLVPGLAWIPAAILLFGIGENATVFLIAITALPVVAISVLGGAKRVDATYLRAARMMGVQGGALVFRVLLPGTLPHIVTGLRLGMGNAWRVMVAAEMIVGTGTGLGYSIIQARWTLDYPAAFACVVVICLSGLVFERLVFANLERWTVEQWELPRTF